MKSVLMQGSCHREVYIYQLRAGETSVTRRMTLIK